MKKSAITTKVGWASLGCATIAVIFIPLAIRSYTDASCVPVSG